MARRLAAILAADVVGYSRLMGEDESGTLDVLRAHRQELIEPKIAEHEGRVVKLMGDGVLVEFSSAVEAVQCAVEIQREISTRNADATDGRSMLWRIGINIGDIIVEGDDIYGDGVNVAARLEGLAESGGICLSDDAYRQVRDKLDFAFKDIGEVEVKNIARPIHAWQWHDGVGETTKSPPWMAKPSATAGKAAVAVLPFANMSGDSEQEYFSDGLTEDIITALALARSFPVIARNSTFVYKGKSADVRGLASELGARYVLEGSVRKGGNRIRVTAQLIDADTGLHVWAEKFDRELTDMFELQDEIVQQITATVGPELERAEQKRAAAKRTHNLDAWDYYQRGMSCLYEFTKAGNEQAREMFELALSRDPNYGQAFSGIAYSYHRDLVSHFTESREDSIAKCLEAARRGVALDPKSSFARVALSLALVWPDQHEQAIAEAEIALELNPNNAQAHSVLGVMLDAVGKSEAGIENIEKGLRLNPQDPRNNSNLTLLARAHLNARRYDDAVAWARKALQLRPGYANANYVLAASLGHLGRRAEARAALADCELAQPGFVSKRRDWKPYRNPSDNAHILEGIRKAGRPD